MPRQRIREGHVWLTLDAPAWVKERIAKLQERTGATSMAEVVRRALVLYDVMTEADAAGATLIVKYKTGEKRELVIT